MAVPKGVDPAMINFKPHLAECTQCGQDYTKTDPRQRLCPDCREANRKASVRHWDERNRERWKKPGPTKKRGPKPSRPSKPTPPAPDPSEHVCRVSGSCRYGSPEGQTVSCHYFIVEGKLRTAGGQHQIVNGRCDLYKRKRKSRRSGWQRRDDEKREKAKGGKDSDK